MGSAQSKPWTERQMQDAVYIHCQIKHHEIMVPNSCVFGWEADMVSVNRHGFIHEFEIKISRYDFKQDAKKNRALLLANPLLKSRTHRRPNYFYFVVPEGLVRPEEVPSYAGLIYVRRRVKSLILYWNTTEIVKPAVRLHRDKITDHQRCQLSRALSVRYWKQRIRLLAPKEKP